jgi:hypothetical protein
VNEVFAWLRALASMTVLLLFAGAATAQTPQTLFEFVSAPGDYIGGGQTVVLTPADVTFSVNTTVFSGQTPGQTLTFALNNYTQGPPPNGIYINWTLNLAAPSGQALAVGSYPNATRYPFQAPTSPGLTVSGNGRGCNQDFGSFEILEIALDPSTGTLLRFAADFTQTCESTTAPPLTGAIRYNSTIPPPELILPSISIAQALNSHGCFEATSASGVEVTATGSATGASSLALAWSTSTGLTGSGNQFSIAVNLNQYLTLSLTATDPVTGATKTVTQQVCSTDTTAPQVTIQSPEPGASYSTLPALDVLVTDAVDKSIKNVQVILGENATFQLNGKEQLHTHITARRAVGDQIVTQMTVYATDASGNIGQSSVTFLVDKSLR